TRPRRLPRRDRPRQLDRRRRRDDWATDHGCCAGRWQMTRSPDQTPVPNFPTPNTQHPTPAFRLGVDIGGTFTDATLIDEGTGEVRIAKVLTTPRDPSQSFLEVVRRILQQADVRPAGVRYLVHATTVATNAIIEGHLAPTGFVTTEGFRDLLEI